MAGAFGGDYNNYEDDNENLEDIQNDLDQTEDVDDLEEDEYEDYEYDDEDYDQVSVENEKALKQAEKKSIENKLKKIRRTAPYRFYPHFTFGERRILSKARKTHFQQVNRINRIMAQRKATFHSKMNSIIGPILPYLLIIGLIILVVIFIAAAISSILSFLFGADTGEKPSASAQFGVNGRDFYGCRVVYSDEEQAQIEIIETYINSIKYSTESSENEDFNIVIELPADDYNYQEFNESEFAQTYSNAYDLLTLIVDEVYTSDYENISGEQNNVDSLSLIEKIDYIKYFGFDNELSNQISIIISNYINDNDLYQIVNNNIDNATVEQTISDNISNYFTNSINVRTEKLFIKDYIFENEDDMMENITEKNYISLIFMPKTQVEFTYLSFIISNADYDNFDMYIQYENNVIDLNKLNFTTKNDGGESYLYETDSNISVPVETFSDISIEDLGYLSEGLSLYNILNGNIDYNIYLQNITNEDGTSILTYKENGLVVKFSSLEPFVFVEWETKW